MQQLQNTIAAQIAAAPNAFSAEEAYARENGKPMTASFTQDASVAVDPYKAPAPVQRTPYRVTFRMDGPEGAGK
jgi:hypothetical protein